MLTRHDLPADPGEAYKHVEEAVIVHRRQERELLALRGEVLRELVGSARGGRSRAAEVLGVTDVQVGRLLVEDLRRAVAAAFADAGFERDDYLVGSLGQGSPPRVSMSMTPDDEDEDEAEVEDDRRISPGWIRRMNTAGAMLNTLHAAGFTAVADGLGVDVDGRGPRATLAEGNEITVTWASAR